MQLRIQRLKDKKWQPIQAKELVDKSLTEFMNTTEDVVIAEVEIETGRKLYVLNNKDWVKRMLEKGEVITSQELALVTEKKGQVDYVIKTFPDADFLLFTPLVGDG